MTWLGILMMGSGGVLMAATALASFSAWGGLLGFALMLIGICVALLNTAERNPKS